MYGMVIDHSTHDYPVTPGVSRRKSINICHTLVQRLHNVLHGIFLVQSQIFMQIYDLLEIENNVVFSNI